ncbi:hypothetical protein [Klebsiella quasivariicola]|uniref:hypothetical protein n=1 Tax=Klebsiella quasivariicola TaxID=2026240 RepID=UPI001CCD1DD2|nr:hypothetical protein [Klebsiella quasivariicola]MBZ9580995.1 hypothetical protein [Klebsiella quasivariicola]
MDNNNTTGTLALASHWQPALKNGKYKITLKYETDINNLTTADYEKGNTLDFNVYTHRFSLNPEDIYSTYPPQNATGKFKNVLPDLVLVRPTLPWEREFITDEKQKPVPWLCLLQINELDKLDINKDIQFKEMSLAEALTGDGETFIPHITYEAEETRDTRCQVLEISKAFFQQLIPSTANISWCAHIRKVNLDYKVTDPQIKRGSFSCLISSRLTALPPQEQAQALKHTVFLVSLEGCQPLFSDGNNKKKIRLFSLFNWSFFVQNEEFDFGASMKRMDVSALHRPLPVMPESMPTEEKQALTTLFDLGFTPMEHYLRDGTATLSWYRGPLCPRAPSPSQDRIVAALPDEKLMYDPENGMFDVSQALAWQLGRLLSIEDQPFSRALIRWRMALKQQAAIDFNRHIIAANLPSRCDNDINAAEQVQDSPYAWIFEQLLDEDNALADPTGLRGVDYASPLEAVSTGWLAETGQNNAMSNPQKEILQLWQRFAEPAGGEGETE